MNNDADEEPELELRLEAEEEPVTKPLLPAVIAVCFLSAFFLFNPLKASQKSPVATNNKASLSVAEKQDVHTEKIVESSEQTAIINQKDEEKIATVTIWDYHSEDGDIVRIQTSKISLDITIMNKPVELDVPYKEGDEIQFIGIRDGGAGITASIELMKRPIPLPLLSVGQAISLPLL